MQAQLGRTVLHLECPHLLHSLATLRFHHISQGRREQGMSQTWRLRRTGHQPRFNQSIY